VYMQSSLLHTHCRLGTARGAPPRTGRGMAISCSFSGEEHCGQFGVGFVMFSPGRVSNDALIVMKRSWYNLLDGATGPSTFLANPPRQPGHNVTLDLQGFYRAAGLGLEPRLPDPESVLLQQRNASV
jgi:hypothetical protein